MANYRPTNEELMLEQLKHKNRMAVLQEQSKARSAASRNAGSGMGAPQQVFRDIAPNPKPKTVSNLVSGNAYGPTLSQYVGTADIRGAVDDIDHQFQQSDLAVQQYQNLYNNINRIDVDEPMVAQELKQYQIDPKIVDDRFAYKKVNNLADKFQKDISSNRSLIGAAVQNYQTRQAYVQRMNDMVREGEITPEMARGMIKRYDAQYAAQGGVGSGAQGVYNPYHYEDAMADPDELKILNDAISDWKVSGDAWARSGVNFHNKKIVGTKSVGGMQHYVVESKDSGAVEYIRASEVMDKLRPQLQNNAKLQAWYKQQAVARVYSQSDQQLAQSADYNLQRFQHIAKIVKDLEDKGNLNQQEVELLTTLRQKYSGMQLAAEAAKAAQNGDFERARELMVGGFQKKYTDDLISLGVGKVAHRKQTAAASHTSAKQDDLLFELGAMGIGEMAKHMVTPTQTIEEQVKEDQVETVEEDALEQEGFLARLTNMVTTPFGEVSEQISLNKTPDQTYVEIDNPQFEAWLKAKGFTKAETRKESEFDLFTLGEDKDLSKWSVPNKYSDKTWAELMSDWTTERNNNPKEYQKSVILGDNDYKSVIELVDDGSVNSNINQYIGNNPEAKKRRKELIKLRNDKARIDAQHNTVIMQYDDELQREKGRALIGGGQGGLNAAITTYQTYSKDGKSLPFVNVLAEKLGEDVEIENNPNSTMAGGFNEFLTKIVEGKEKGWKVRVTDIISNTGNDAMAIITDPTGKTVSVPFSASDQRRAHNMSAFGNSVGIAAYNATPSKFSQLAAQNEDMFGRPLVGNQMEENVAEFFGVPKSFRENKDSRIIRFVDGGNNIVSRLVVNKKTKQGYRRFERFAVETSDGVRLMSPKEYMTFQLQNNDNNNITQNENYTSRGARKNNVNPDSRYGDNITPENTQQ